MNRRSIYTNLVAEESVTIRVKMDCGGNGASDDLHSLSGREVTNTPEVGT